MWSPALVHSAGSEIWTSRAGFSAESRLQGPSPEGTAGRVLTVVEWGPFAPRAHSSRPLPGQTSQVAGKENQPSLQNQ